MIHVFPPKTSDRSKSAEWTVKAGSIAYVRSVSKRPIEADRSMEETGSQVHLSTFLRKESNRKLDRTNGKEKAICYLSNFWKQELRSLCTKLYAGQSVHDHIIFLRKESDRKLDQTNGKEKPMGCLSNFWKQELRSLCTKLYAGQSIHDHMIFSRAIFEIPTRHRPWIPLPQPP